MKISRLLSVPGSENRGAGWHLTMNTLAFTVCFAARFSSSLCEEHEQDRNENNHREMD